MSDEPASGCLGVFTSVSLGVLGPHCRREGDALFLLKILFLNEKPVRNSRISWLHRWQLWLMGSPKQ